jgi:type III secretion protein V
MKSVDVQFKQNSSIGGRLEIVSWMGNEFLRLLTRRGDIAVVVLLAAVVALMILPMPVLVLDLLIAINIAASICLLMLAIYVPSAVALSTFPSLLLFTTLLRLSLNIASTKQILLNGNAGHIIETFGKLVVGGSAIVGGVVFVIIAVVQFIVIAKGAERVAEVGARFTLDGMPGKQMSIDADLRAGLISKDEARQRREELEHESQWHGAMDGAMKFVKGDAIAGLVIAFVNIVAGIGVGVGVKELTLSEAVQRYTVLTVGDGMVSQIPSLFVSVAAGILITRVASTQDSHRDLGRQLVAQVFAQPMAMLMTAALLFAFLLVPGFPKFQFLLLGAAAMLIGYLAWKRDRRTESPESLPLDALRGDAERIAPPMIQTATDRSAAPVLVRLAPSFKGRLSRDKLSTHLLKERHDLYESIGLPFPGIRLRYDERLATDSYRIDAQDVAAAEGLAKPGHLWVPDHVDAEIASKTTEGKWIPEDRAGFMANAVASLDRDRWCIENYLAALIGMVIRSRASMFVGIQEVQRILDETARNQPELAQEIVRAIPLQRVAEVLRRLVQEGVSLRNTKEIFESLILWAPREKDIFLLTEYVRVDVGSVTVSRIAQGRSEIPLVILSQPAEHALRDSLQESIGGVFLTLNPARAEYLVAQIREMVDNAREQGLRPAVACSMDLRRHLKRLIEVAVPNIPVLSYQEIGTHIRVASLGAVEIDALQAP